MKKILACFLSLIVFASCSNTTSAKEENINFKVNASHTNFSVTIEEFEDLLNICLPESLDGYTESSFSMKTLSEYEEMVVNDTTSVEAFIGKDKVVEYIRVHGSGIYDEDIASDVGAVAGAILGASKDEVNYSKLTDDSFDMFESCVRTDGTEAYGSAVLDHYMMSVDYIENDGYCNFSIWIRPTTYTNNEDYLSSTDYETTYGAYCSAIAEDNEQESSEETTDSQPTEQQPRTYWGEGMYKVGVDIPAGEYNVTAELGESAYLEVSADSTGDSIITNDVFENNLYITVTDGQYLTLKRCYISLE